VGSQKSAHKAKEDPDTKEDTGYNCKFVLVWHETHVDDRRATGVRRGYEDDVLSSVLVEADVSLSTSERTADGARVRDVYGLHCGRDVCRDSSTSGYITGKREDEVVTASRSRDSKFLPGDSLMLSSFGLGGLLLRLVLVLVLVLLLFVVSTTVTSMAFIFGLLSFL